ncbi:hypothetical protein B0H66DRAFT_535368 [Apodospora peruviana]|uniref:Ysc84 actin-binding domain-containing protein n=1 Tax=Apodospora peruviana TaxID=516989 RepID=A0AAE0HWX6_9PEZI|nr:hypothetical protein B0H66DRAFT_535368 [Apodospora peruviana]
MTLQEIPSEKAANADLLTATNNPPQPHQYSAQASTETEHVHCDCHRISTRHQQKWQKLQTGLEFLSQKIAYPLNSAATNRGCESFVPLSMEEECAKAARILRSFSSDQTNDNNTIPHSALSSAIGILIITTGRLGLSRLSGSTGSGVLLVRREDTDTGEWGLPAAIQTHGIGLGPINIGFAVSDRVYLIRTREATLDLLDKKKGFTLGPEAVLAAGSWGTVGGAGMTFSGSLQGVAETIMKRKEEMKRRKRERRQRKWAKWAKWSGSCECQCNHHHHMAAAARGQVQSEETQQYGDDGAKFVDEKSALLLAEAVIVENDHADWGDAKVKEEEVETKPAAVPAVNTESSRGSETKPGSGSAFDRPVHCYLRSYGLYAGLQAEGTIFTERADENARFYGTASFNFAQDASAGEHVFNVQAGAQAALTELREALVAAEAGAASV